MHRQSSDLAVFDKRICSCRECSQWGPPIVDWRKRRSPKHGKSVAWRGQWWWKNRHGYYIAWDPITKRTVYLHRRMWETHRGPIPDGFHIHHIDHDKQNNQIDNLDAMHGEVHAAYHGIECSPRHRTRAGPKTVYCEQCGGSFIVTKLPSRKKFCSRSCILADRRAKKASQAKPHPICTCNMCGASFTAMRCDAKFCSRRCSTASKDRTEYNRAYYLAHPEKYARTPEQNIKRNARRRELARYQREKDSGERTGL